MMLSKSSSTGKSKVKRMQLARMTEYSTCSKVLLDNKYKEDYERPQPVRIVQLLKSESKKSASKDGVQKRMLPERLGTCSTKKTEGKTHQYVQPGKSARRILNFNGPSIARDQYEHKDRANRFGTVEYNRKDTADTAKQVKRMSFIRPPNAIKKEYLQRCVNEVNSYSKLAKVSKETNDISDKSRTKKDTKAVNESTVVNINVAKLQYGSRISDKSQIVNNTDDTRQSKIPDAVPVTLIPQCVDLPQITRNSKDDLIAENSERNELDTESKEIDSPLQNLCKDLQNTKLAISENDTKCEHGTTNAICIEREKLISLQHDLQNCLRQAEENTIKLRAGLMCIASLISTFNDKPTGIPDIQLQGEPKIMVHKEIQVEICPEETAVSLVRLENAIENKENRENFNTTMQLLDVTTNSSFLELENKLNIIHTEPTQDHKSHTKTPVTKRYKQKSFKEYMALKSSISFLETPDGKRFRSLRQIDNVDKSDLNSTTISKKLLENIINLNSESPGSDM